ncbi:MAG: ATPase [Bacteroidetes bacterium]|nr:ATPase [Bacteroidota bacterium]
MKSLLLSLVILAATCSTTAQESSVQETQFKVFGNCNMCKARIEKAVKIDGVRFAKWNKSSKMLKVAFDTTAVTADSLRQRIAAVGHDTETFKAPDSVYEGLPGCCLYRDHAATH